MARLITGILKVFFLYRVACASSANISQKSLIEHEYIWKSSPPLFEPLMTQVYSKNGKLLDIKSSKSQVFLKIITTLVVVAVLGYLFKQCSSLIRKNTFFRSRRLSTATRCDDHVEYHRVDIEAARARYRQPVKIQQASDQIRLKKLKLLLLVSAMIGIIIFGYHFRKVFQAVVDAAETQPKTPFCNEVLTIKENLVTSNLGATASVMSNLKTPNNSVILDPEATTLLVKSTLEASSHQVASTTETKISVIPNPTEISHSVKSTASATAPTVQDEYTIKYT